MLPVLPDTAPFTPEQRGWLNGYIAALFGSGLGGGAAIAPRPPVKAPPTSSCPPVTIAWGSQTGNGESLARRAAKKLTEAGANVRLHDMAAYPTEQLVEEKILLVITSTYGDGEPPDNAADFHAFLHSADAPRFDQTHFAVFALGDSQYPDFCACGKQIDTRLEQLGAQRFIARVDADVDFDQPFSDWSASLLARLPSLAAATSS